MTQQEKILRHLKEEGALTAFEAMRDYGIMRLASRISELKMKGHNIKSEIITVKNRFNEDCKVAKYSLEKKLKQTALLTESEV